MTTPIDPAHHMAMNLIALNVDDQLNPLRHITGKRVTGFMMTVFDFDTPEGRFNYISNAPTLDVHRMLQNVLARLDSRVGQNTEEMVVVSRADVKLAIEHAKKVANQTGLSRTMADANEMAKRFSNALKGGA